MPIHAEVVYSLSQSTALTELVADSIAEDLVKLLLIQIPKYSEVDLTSDSMPAVIGTFRKGFFELLKNLHDAKATKLVIKFVQVDGHDSLCLIDNGMGIVDESILQGKSSVDYAKVIAATGKLKSKKRGQGLKGGAGLGLAQLTHLLMAKELSGMVTIGNRDDGVRGAQISFSSISVDMENSVLDEIFIRENKKGHIDTDESFDIGLPCAAGLSLAAFSVSVPASARSEKPLLPKGLSLAASSMQLFIPVKEGGAAAAASSVSAKSRVSVRAAAGAAARAAASSASIDPHFAAAAAGSLNINPHLAAGYVRVYPDVAAYGSVETTGFEEKTMNTIDSSRDEVSIASLSTARAEDDISDALFSPTPMGRY